ncbi:MAG: hypothetical protein JWR80_1389 [Bradyrhizobium sp.]|nr:hypothetical protein [Bradyrhizobium sp.]
MLPLNDPLWKKLDDAHRDRDIPQLLSRLSEAWDDKMANSLFWDCLCHQGTCYGATYAATPHLLKIAQAENNRHQRLEIALFAGFVVHCALKARQDDRSEDQALPGLPETPEEWDRKLDCYRDLLANLQNAGRHISHYERTELLPRYRKVLRAGTVVRADMDRIRAIKVEFLSALPMVREICERALRENLRNENAMVPLLGGVAATEGHIDLSNLLYQGKEGSLRCTHCNWRYDYVPFGNQVALYAEQGPPISGAHGGADSPLLLDFKEGAASRSDGFIVPAEDGQTLAPSARQLLQLANLGQAPAVLLRNFLGSFRCRRCGANVTICPSA